MVTEHVEGRVAETGLYSDPRVLPLALVSAEELTFCEGFAQRGRTFFSLAHGWKASPGSRQSFKNYLIELGGGTAARSDHADEMFARSTAERAKRIFGKDYDPEDVRQRLEGRDTGESGKAAS